MRGRVVELGFFVWGGGGSGLGAIDWRGAVEGGDLFVLGGGEFCERGGGEFEGGWEGEGAELGLGWVV